MLTEPCDRYVSDNHSHSVADHSVPSELKLAYPGGKVRASCGNALGYASPSFMGDALRAPGWWNTTDVMTTLYLMLAEKVSMTYRQGTQLTIPLHQSKKPTFMQRLLNGNTPRQSRPTAGEELARRAMRNRACESILLRSSSAKDWLILMDNWHSALCASSRRIRAKSCAHKQALDPSCQRRRSRE